MSTDNNGRAQDLLPLLAAVDNALRNGSHMNGANYAFLLLCDRLGVDRDALVFDPSWSRPCCDLHGRNCEQGGEECCYGCSEARHFEPGHGGVPCVLADSSAVGGSAPDEGL